MYSVKKIFASALVMATALCSYANIIYYKSDFSSFTPESPLAGWECFGLGDNAKDEKLGSTTMNIKDLFPEGSPAYKIFSFDGLPYAAYSNSTVVSGRNVEEWLVSPLIHIEPGKPCMLDFTSAGLGSVRKADFDVYVSSEGSSKENFIKSSPVFSGKQQGGASSPKTNVNRVVIPPQDGDLYIAFVNKSSGKGLLGFYDIVLSDYDIEVENNTPSFLQSSGEIQVNLTLSIQTPVNCNSLEVRVDFSNGETRSESFSADLFSGLYTVTSDIGSPVAVNEGENLTYTVTVTPGYDNSVPTVLSYGICCNEGYPSVCVMEEGTGLWCSNCIRGFAAMERYSEKFGDRFIGLAVHAQDNMTVPSYIDPLQRNSGGYSVPFGWYNRSRRNDPIYMEEVEKILTERVPHKIDIDEVYYESVEGNDRITVVYSPEFCYSTDCADVSAVAVIAEDSCSSPGWIQANGYSGKTVDECFGQEWWPYFEHYSKLPSMIANMEFNHIAWGIYNDYFGEDSVLPKKWESGVAQSFSITFDVPLQKDENGPGVQNPRNTFVVVMLLDRQTGKILSADKLSASDYIWNGYGNVHQANIGSEWRVINNGSEIDIDAESGVVSEVFTVDGVKTAGYVCSDNGVSFNLAPGIWIIRLNDGCHTLIKKIKV